jgi:hypothetical protein
MSLFELLNPETEDTTILRNAGKHRGAHKSLAPPTSRCILFDGENISFDASLVTYTHTHTIGGILVLYTYIVLEFLQL